MNRIKKIIAILVMAALLTVGGTVALAADDYDPAIEEDINDPTCILPMGYWQT